LIHRARQKRWATLCIVNLRILLGYAFLPAGLKKVLGQPFTDPDNVGPFHDFLHAFHATGFFYHFVGSVQLTCALLLMTQTLPTLGALLALPVFTAIAAFCWSTATVFTSVMVTLMLCGTALLLVWDYERWRGLVVRADAEPGPVQRDDEAALVDMTLWRGCGAAILILYVGITAYSGGIYRPKGVELDNPAFYVFPVIATFPIITLVVEQLRRRSAR
jgi:uncharacterized membrane protein YphA (DoxX/SURF4 family)